MFHEAFIHFHKAEHLFFQENNLFHVVYCLSYKYKTNIKLGLEEEALHLLEKSKRLTDSLDYDPGKLFVYPLLAQEYIETDIEKAEDLVTKLFAIDDFKKDNKDKASIYEVSSYIYKAKGDLNKSLEMYRYYSQYRDSMLRESNENLLQKEALDIEYNKKLIQNQLEYQSEKEELKQNNTARLVFVFLGCSVLLAFGLMFYRNRVNKHQIEKDEFIKQIEKLKSEQSSSSSLQSGEFHLSREKIESKISKKINETDWIVMNILLEDPVISNKEIAKKAFMSVYGIGSSLRRMYELFDIKESKYMKVSLLMELIKISK